MAIQSAHEGRLFETRNDLDRDTRIEMVEMLNMTLADATDLMTQVKHAHWNVKGREFQQLHELFDEQAALLQAHMDLVAERATAIGGTAMGTARMAASESRIEAYPEDVFVGMDIVDALADRFAHHAQELRADIEQAMDAGDEDTADLYVELSRDIDKQLWFLESHLQDDSSIEETGVTISADH